ncbi:uncharacterized protein MELLADRAFT_95094 [Melampsora larici-populina 98AG31]|uniref:DNA 3'-5' helicase n=1 Tax=Melampsora larici-populina (strain 98AG31 / pathotype 3-4-7) TaxID=747676 RepID=F4S944_MELLP|nr:uncharacterized protein MELLADRAFT_95094 [Melampsora larici-populina 98AG31]EGF98851.1 hypothetical protein MELLADRAFT_95094 [Melampsora larici-populina 98AG31]
MEHAKSTLHDLKNLFTSRTKVFDNQIPPTLIYTNTRRKTMTALKVLNRARGVVKGEYNPISTFACRFHSNTGPTDKTAAIADYSNGVYPVITCTLALGLGQNWTRVRQVIQMGRADAAAVSQIIGRCGRNGNPGLAVFYVEKHRNKGKNLVADFKGLTKFSDDNLMDGLAVTPVCLRIAFTLSSLIGKIPMSEDEEIYVQEKSRQAEMCACRCSNCEPEASKLLAAKMKWLTTSNFDAAIKNPEALADLARQRSNVDAGDIAEDIPTELDPDAPITNRKPNGPPPRRIELMELANQLTLTIKEHHLALMEGHDRLKASAYLTDDDIWRILDRIYTIKTHDDVYNILGCDMLPGGVAKLFKCIEEWNSSSLGAQAMTEMRAREAATRLIQAETLTRLQKQHEERELKAQEARAVKSNKRKQHEVDQLAETEAKRQRKDEKDKKKQAAAKSKADKDARIAANKRMMDGLHAGKSIEQVDAEEKIRFQHAGKENEIVSSNDT